MKNKHTVQAVRRVLTVVLAIFPCLLLGCQREPAPASAPSPSSAKQNNPWQRWQLDDGWQAAEEDGESVLEGSGHSWAYLTEGEWSACDLRLSIRILEGTVHLNILRSVSESVQSRYFIGVGNSGLYLGKQVDDVFSDLAEVNVSLDDGWHEIWIQACDGLLNVRVDGELFIAYEDAEFLGAGSVAFESLEDSHVLVRGVTVGTADAASMTAPSVEETTLRIQQEARGAFIPDETHEGDLVLGGTDVLTIENEQFLQLGNVYINDSAKLILRNATFMLGRGNVPTVHVYINVAEGASLVIDHTTVIEKAEEGAGMLIVIRNHGTTSIAHSPAEIHLLEQYDGTVEISGTEMINEIGGLLQVSGGVTRVTDSTLGALVLTVPAGASLDVSGLTSGQYCQMWDVRDWIPEVDYTLTLERTSILEDRLAPGPYERGWLFLPNADSHVRLSDSQVRKFFIDISGVTAFFENLKIGTPSSLTYRDIQLDAVTATGQWPFTIKNSDVTIKNSDYLFLQPSGSSNLTLTDSHMVEFIPREFYGTLSCENCTWTNAGEIIGGESYHSAGNDFTITGSLAIAPELRTNLQWKDARVTREFTAEVADSKGRPLPGLLIMIHGQGYTTDADGRVAFSLTFDENNYDVPEELEVSLQEEVLFRDGIDFFTSTPIAVTLD